MDLRKARMIRVRIIVEQRNCMACEADMSPAEAGEDSAQQRAVAPLSRAAIVVRKCPGLTPRLYAHACFAG